MIKCFRSKEQVENETPHDFQEIRRELEDLTKCVRQLERRMIQLEGQMVIVEEL